MERMRMLLNLDNTLGTFDFGDRNLAMLESSFPQITFARTRSVAELERKIGDADLVATWEFPVELYEKAPRLRAVFSPAAGRERVAEDPRGKVFVHYGSYHGELLAESLLGLMLAFNRQLLRILEHQRAHVWEREYLGQSSRLGRQHVLIIGYGNIGRACAALLKPFGCRITGVRRSPRDPSADRDADAIVPFDELHAVLPEADHVVIILPSDTGTDRIITRDHFRAMKRGAYLYNFGRGNCYAEDDIVWAIESGTIAGAALDVFDHEPLPAGSRLWDLPNVIVLPHGAVIYPDYMELFTKEMTALLRGVLDRR